MIHKKQGFTIVELLIVVVVIAILAAITIISYNGVQKRAVNAQVATAVSQWEKIFKTYLINGGAINAFTGGTCLSASFNDFSAGGTFSAGECADGALQLDTTMITTLKASSVASIPKTVLPTISNNGTLYRGLYGLTIGNTIRLIYYLNGSSCLISSDSGTVTGSTVECLRTITAS